MVMLTASALAILGFFAVMSCPDPRIKEQTEKGAFKWADVKSVLATWEWGHLATTYLVFGMSLNFGTFLGNIVLVKEYGFAPWQVGVFFMAPMFLTTTITGSLIGPKILSNYGPRPLAKYCAIPAGIIELLKINWRRKYDTLYLVCIIVGTAISFSTLTAYSPACSAIMPRVLKKYGSVHTYGTVAGLTRVWYSAGRTMGPILGATLYHFDSERLLLNCGTTGVLSICIGCYALLLMKSRPALHEPLRGTRGEERMLGKHVQQADE